MESVPYWTAIGDDRQREGNLEGGHLREPPADADGAVGMTALSGAERHAELAEEDEVHHQEQVAGEAEVGEDHRTEDRRDEEVGAQASGEAEDGSEKEHHPVDDGGAVRVGLDDVDERLPDRLPDAALNLRGIRAIDPMRSRA